MLASKYRLEELLGSGGMGHVYRAVNEDVGRTVAIKILRSEHATQASLVERFLREARAANLVRHPNVVDVLDVGRDGDGSPFIVQELLHGQDLARFVAGRGGKLSLDELEEYLLPVIDAVAEAHAQGVVHRDIKPENVFLAEQGRRRIPKLLDFGISKMRRPDIRVTEVGVMMGTPAYMAPEQVQGSRDADARTDIWALGVTLFELLSGRLPFEVNDAPALFVAIATQDVPRLADVMPQIAPNISRVVERCVRRLPDERYPSAQELARDLRHALEGSEIEPTQKHSFPPPKHADLVVPELALPSPQRGPSPAANTLPHASFELESPRPTPNPTGRAEMSFADDIPPDAPSVPDLAPAPAARGPSTQEAARRPAAPIGAELSLDSPRSHVAPDRAMPGVMLAPHAPGMRPAPPLVLDRREPTPAPTGPDVALLVGLAAVGLTAIGSTAVLTALIHQPGGFPLVAMVTKPTPTLNLAVHGGLGIVATVIAARSAAAGVRRWRDFDGGRASALFAAVVAGALLFAAIELARAAW